ncbi:MAG: hypothetical protein H6937_02475 [Burkholderiales bacterium]|nr:hypothetical protein [Burkholderiales bacterium]
MNYFYDVFGWYVGTSGESRRSTLVAPVNTSTSNQEGQLRSNWTGRAWVEMQYAQRTPPVHIDVPYEITKYQGVLYLSRQSQLTDLETALNTAGGEVLLAYKSAAGFRRDNPFLNDFLKNARGMTDSEIDQWFIGANKIKE